MKIKFNNEVEGAAKNNKPIVALESTIISHGLPYPDNLEVAKSLEEAVREKGAIPATIAILGGEVHIGLTDEALAMLADPNSRIEKASRRDIPHLWPVAEMGQTTVRRPCCWHKKRADLFL